MEDIKNYILSIAGFSFIASLISSLLPEISSKRTVRFICGVVLSILLLSPLKGCEPDFSNIFSEYESYNLNDNSFLQEELKQKIISDKVSEVVRNTFLSYGISEACAEVVFDGELNIVSVNINAANDSAAREVAGKLGLPYEIIQMTE